MPANFLHGVETIEIDKGSKPVRVVKSAVIGLIGTAPIQEVDPEYRKINEPVLITNDTDGASLIEQTDLSDAQYMELLEYIQSLRDLPETINFENPVFPIKPEFVE